MPLLSPSLAAWRTAPHPFTDQRGVGLPGFLLVALPVLWLGLGGVELAHWMQIRQTLSLALMEAARAGATHHGEPQAVAAAFEHGVRQIHPGPGERERLFRQRRQALGLPWQIIIRQPLRQAFADHADPRLAPPQALPGQQFIRNEAQPLQHRLRLAQGWPEGRGPASGTTIFEANTLELALYWPHRPILPGIGALIRTLAPQAADPRSRQWMAAGYLPFRRSVGAAMQSAPATWPDLPDGRVVHVHPSGATSASPGQAPGAGPLPAAAAPGTHPAATPGATPRPWPDDGAQGSPIASGAGSGAAAQGGSTHTEGAPWQPDDPDACMVP